MSLNTACLKGLNQCTICEALEKTAAKMVPIRSSSAHGPHSVLSEEEQQSHGKTQEDQQVSDDSQEILMAKFNVLLIKHFRPLHNKTLKSS